MTLIFVCFSLFSVFSFIDGSVHPLVTSLSTRSSSYVDPTFLLINNTNNSNRPKHVGLLRIHGDTGTPEDRQISRTRPGDNFKGGFGDGERSSNITSRTRNHLAPNTNLKFQTDKFLSFQFLLIITYFSHQVLCCANRLRPWTTTASR